MSRPPITLFVYNRLVHTILTLEALQKNLGARETILYIFSDGPRSDADAEGVAAVRNYVKGVAGFADVILVERERNLGLARSLMGGIDEALGTHESIIVLEDDLVTSPYFLQFMNDALNMYADNPLVASVQGYLPPLGIQLPHVFFLRYVGCWGWGTWRRGWDLFEPDSARLLSDLKRKGLSHEFDVGGYPFTRMLARQVAGELDSWAIRWHAALFLADKLSLYPGESLVQNIGHDGSGIHCNQSSHFDVPLADMAISVGKENPMKNINAHKALAAYFREIHPSLTNKIFQVARQLFN
jgi:hypothetical protein